MTDVVVTTAAISRAKLQSNHHHQQTNTQTSSVGALKGKELQSFIPTNFGLLLLSAFVSSDANQLLVTHDLQSHN